MATTLPLPEAGDDMVADPPLRDRRHETDTVVAAVHRMLSERREFFDRTLNEGIARHAVLLDRLAR